MTPSSVDEFDLVHSPKGRVGEFGAATTSFPSNIFFERAIIHTLFRITC